MKPTQIISREEERALLKLLDSRCGARTGLRDYLAVLLMLDAGLRVGELVQLRTAALVREGWVQESVIVPADIAKTRVERTIPLSGRLKYGVKAMHTEWLRCQAIEPAATACQSQMADTDPPPWHGGYCLFKGVQHWVPLSVRAVQKMVERQSVAAFGRRIYPHILRHTFATRLMAVTDMRHVQALLGHKSITSTQVYTHPDSESMRSAVDQAFGRAV